MADASLMPTVLGRVVVRRARCPARPRSARCVYTPRPRIYTPRPRTIWLRRELRDRRGVLLHELGHVYDALVMNDRDRGRVPADRRGPPAGAEVVEGLAIAGRAVRGGVLVVRALRADRLDHPLLELLLPADRGASSGGSAG